MNDVRKVKINFSDKAKLFDDIAALFYRQNFGTASKGEIDLLMFKIYIEELIQQNINDDKTVDYNLISDYRIARDLGITPQRVRNLKLKKDLFFPQEFDWKVSFTKLITDSKRIRVDERMIKISIPDPVLFMEIQNFIEEQGGYIDIQLNSKLLMVPIRDFEQLIKLVCSAEEYNDFSEMLEKEYKRVKQESIPEKDKYDKAKIISEIVANSAQAASDVANIFNPTGMAAKGLTVIFNKVMEVIK